MSLRATEQIFTGATTPISLYDSTKINLGSLMSQKKGINPQDNFVGPFPIPIARPMEESTFVAMMYPHVLNISPTIDWIFLTENLAAATVARRIFLYEYTKTSGIYNWKGFITATLPSAANINTTRGFRALRYLHTTGTVSVTTPTSYYALGTSVALAVNGTVTGVGTTFTQAMVGMMIGFGSTNPALINCWYPIVTFTGPLALVVSGASNAIAASANYVIATCTVTGVSTLFVTDTIAAGTATSGVAGGLGPRIGFGSNNPNQITKWYQIGIITSDTSLNINTSPGVIAAGTMYVIEELRFVMSVSQAVTPTNGGLFLLKGVGYMDFTTTGNTFPSIASAVSNQRGVYWLADASTVTNTAPNGCAVESETNKSSHFVYVIDGTNTSNVKVYKYNLRANDAVVAGKMVLSAGNVVITGTIAVTGTIPNQACNNGVIATLSHGPGSGASYLYFVTTTRLYCAAVSGITSTSTAYITLANARQEVPPGGVNTFPATGAMMNIQNADSIDRLIITTFTGAGLGSRQYVTRYPATDGTPFDHIFGVDDKQLDQSYISSQAIVHFNSGSQIITVDVGTNGIVHLCKNSIAQTTNQMYALPFGAHWTYAYTTTPANHQRIITPSMPTVGCVKFDQIIVDDDDYFGTGELRISPEPYRIYYRTTNISSDATSSWVLTNDGGDISAAAPSSAIQFMFEFFTIGNVCLPSRIIKIIVIFEDGSTDSHFQLSAAFSNIVTKKFVWRFFQRFGNGVPIMKIEIFNADSSVSIMSDTTSASANGVWEKSTDGGVSWNVYDSLDKTNDSTYIRYSPNILTDNIRVKALLTQN